MGGEGEERGKRTFWKWSQIRRVWEEVEIARSFWLTAGGGDGGLDGS